MAKRSLSVTTVTPTATADTTNLVDATYLGALQGGNGTQKVNIIEVFEGGQAPSTSSPVITLLSRDSQAATGALTLTGSPMFANDSALDGSNSALATTVKAFTAAATLKPQRDTANHLLNLSFNAFGGAIRWVAAPGEEISIVGNTASLGEASLSAFTGGSPGLMGSHIIYEPL